MIRISYKENDPTSLYMIIPYLLLIVLGYILFYRYLFLKRICRFFTNYMVLSHKSIWGEKDIVRIDRYEIPKLSIQKDKTTDMTEIEDVKLIVTVHSP